MHRHVVVRKVRVPTRRSSPPSGRRARRRSTRRSVAGGSSGPISARSSRASASAGTAVTVSSHPGDNLMIHAAVEVCEDGDVLVVTNTAPSSHGMFGELLATSVMARGVRALVVDAGVRDTAELRQLGFPVWSRHVSCQGTVKATAGSVNVPVVIGGVVIAPGDVICADDDGVVAVPATRRTGRSSSHGRGSPTEDQIPGEAGGRRARRRLLRTARQARRARRRVRRLAGGLTVRVAVLGLGEAGSLFASDLVAAGAGCRRSTRRRCRPPRASCGVPTRPQRWTAQTWCSPSPVRPTPPACSTPPSTRWRRARSSPT